MRSHALDVDNMRAVLGSFVDNLPTAATYVERLILHGLLLDAAWRFGQAAHSAAHSGPSRRCPFVPAAVLDRCWPISPHHPEAAFRRWMEGFVTDFERA